MRLIDANEVYELHSNYPMFARSHADLTDLRDILDEATTVDAVEVDAIQAWLYEIAMNNTGNVSRVCEELISRLDGLRVFAKERRTNEG